jgi:ankyrin repeat protein
MKQLLITIAAVVLVGCGDSTLKESDLLPLSRSPLLDAVTEGNIEAAKQAIDDGEDVNVTTDGGMNFLHYAAGAGHKEIAEVLITNGADLNAKDLIVDSTPLHWAVKYEHKEIAELLVDEGADVNAKDMDGETPLHKTGPKEIVKLLIVNGADVNAKNKFGHTATYLANLRNETETADLLRKHGGKTGEELKAEGK